MKLEHGVLYLNGDDIAETKRILSLLLPVDDQTDFFDLKIPVLLALYEVMAYHSFPFDHVQSISSSAEDEGFVSAIRFHFQALQEMKG